MTAEELKQGILDTFFRIADRFGVPVVILAVVLYFGREAAIALHHTVLEPVVKNHVQFLETTSETLHEIGKTQERQAETLQEIAAGQQQIKEVITKTATTHAENVETKN
jgi:hypothetical protein